MRTLFLLLGSALSLNASAASVLSEGYREPQTISPTGDKEFLSHFDFEPTPGDETRNFLFVAQDRRAPKSIANKKTFRQTDGKADAPVLASRGDILLVVSVNRVSKKWSIFSFYRGMTVPASCGTDLSGTENYLANFYYDGGRRLLIPCVEAMMKERIRSNPILAEKYGLSSGTFKINGFFEGTKEETINPLANDVKDVVFGLNGVYFAWIYGGDAIEAAFSVFLNKEDIKKALSGEIRASELTVDGRYLYTEAKERQAYAAAGYQRAFNFAKMIADFLGWVACGINYDSQIWTKFEAAFNKNFSHSMTLRDFMNLISVGEENLLSHAGYRNGQSTVDVIQFGDRQMAIYDGQTIQSKSGKLQGLRTDIQILPKAPDLN